MNTEQLRAELLPCPFCGESKNLIVQHCEGTIIHPAYRIHCGNCGASSGYADRVDPTKYWNSRAALQTQEQPIPYAGVTVWVGNKQCSHGVTKDELELSTFDILQAVFDRARRVEGDGK